MRIWVRIVALTCFALTTIVGWYFFAESNVKFIFGEKRLAVSLFRVISLAFLVVGTLVPGDLVWTLADLFMGLMALPNIVALILLWKQPRFILRDYAQGQKEGSLTWTEAKLRACRKEGFRAS